MNGMTIRSLIGRRGRALFCLLLIALLALPALAQDGGRRDGRDFGRGNRGMGGFMGRPFQPDFLRRDVELIQRELALDDVQASILEAILLDYQEAFDAASEGAREQLESLRPQREVDPEVQERRRALMEERRELARALRDLRRRAEAAPGGEGADRAELEKLQATFEALRQESEALRPSRPEPEEMAAMFEQVASFSADWSRERRQLREKFLADVQAILTEPQMAQWPGFERALRRVKSMSRGRLAGEGADIFIILRDLRLDPEATWPIEELLEAYAAELDVALAARDEMLETARTDTMQAIVTGDYETALRIADEEASRRVAVRSVNERFAGAIAEVLNEEVSEEIGQRFQAAFRARAYPRIFRPTWGQRSFEVAVGLDDLDDDALIAIEGLFEAYQAELAGANARLLEATREQEPRRTRERLERRAQRGQLERGERGEVRRVPDQEDPARLASQRRSELDRAYRANLESLLTPEQIALLPEPPAERAGRNRWRDRGSAEDRAERRRQIMQRFDTNGDGELNDAEREALRDMMRQERGDRGDRGRRGADQRPRRGDPRNDA